ncbi:hypothetical protein [Neptunomonas antarctica]|uniref:Uncharacterized protein n=1 Tax=Neptunomonas antarctica TaxID=619304 RepID=A0A1N7ISH4_9GAMM|nr:hypothetical protein [Neptunomonas antarctica]SIS39987.1 hypothetical protein SAMN05421760_10153 [Neptunomonas antarctica]
MTIENERSKKADLSVDSEIASYGVVVFRKNLAQNHLLIVAPVQRQSACRIRTLTAQCFLNIGFCQVIVNLIVCSIAKAL